MYGNSLPNGGGGGGEAGILSIVQTLYTDIITGINCPLVLLIKKTIYIIITSIYLSLFFRGGGGHLPHSLIRLCRYDMHQSNLCQAIATNCRVV